MFAILLLLHFLKVKLLSSISNLCLQALYGVKKQNKVARCDFSKIQFEKFNENVHPEHVMKCIVICGVLFGFRSLTEHLHLRPTDIVSGTYEEGHSFARKDFVGVGGLVDKTQKLTVHSNYICNTAHLMNKQKNS